MSILIALALSIGLLAIAAATWLFLGPLVAIAALSLGAAFGWLSQAIGAALVQVPEAE